MGAGGCVGVGVSVGVGVGGWVCLQFVGNWFACFALLGFALLA